MAIAQNRAGVDNAHMATCNKIKALRKAADLSSEELAERIGVSQTFMSRLESGERRLSEEYILNIAKELRCTPNDIFGYSTPTPQINEDALEFSVNLAIEVVRDIPGGLADEHITEAVLFVYNQIVRDGLLNEKEPRRTVRAVRALKEHLAPAPKQHTDAK